MKVSLSSIFYTQSSLAQGNLQWYVCFLLRRIWTDSSLSIFRTVWYNVNNNSVLWGAATLSCLWLTKPYHMVCLFTTILVTLYILSTGPRTECWVDFWLLSTFCEIPNWISILKFHKRLLWTHVNNLEVSIFVFMIPFVIKITQFLWNFSSHQNRFVNFFS